MRGFCVRRIRDKIKLMVRSFFILVISLFLTVPLTAQAQQIELFQARNPVDLLSGLHYTYAVEDALRRDPHMRFDHLRALYALMDFYEPNADILLRTLFERAEAVDRFSGDKNAQAYQDALESYTRFVTRHIGHPDIIWTASILAEVHTVLGDSRLYRWIYKGLKDVLVTSGNGNFPESAYHIYSWGEEVMLFNHLGLQIVETETVTNGPQRFHVHSAYDPKNDKSLIVFTNITAPTQNREEKERKNAKPFDFRVFSDTDLQATNP